MGHGHADAGAVKLGVVVSIEPVTSHETSLSCRCWSLVAAMVVAFVSTPDQISDDGRVADPKKAKLSL